jgi:hypothetical protein
MSDSSIIYHGVVHGRIIQLFDDPGVPEGTPVAVQLQSMQTSSMADGQESASAGAWADFPEMDAIMAAVERDRAANGRPEIRF